MLRYRSALATTGRSRAKRLNARAQVLRYGVLNEWRGLREMSVRSRSAVQAIRPAVSLRMRFLLKAFGEVPSDLSAL